MDVRALLEAPPETLVPVGWIREHLLPAPDPVLVRYRLALEVASLYWAGVIRGELPPPLAPAGRIAHGDGNDHHEAHPPMPNAWREKFGTKGVSRVTLFTRPGESPFIYIEWWRNGKRVTRRLECGGFPVDDVSVARALARETVQKLEDRAKEEFWMSMASKPDLVPESVKRMLGIPSARPGTERAPTLQSGIEIAAQAMESATVGDVFDRWLAVQDADLKAKGISAKQWKAALGHTTLLASVTSGDLLEKVRQTSAARGWSDKTRWNKIQHLSMAMKYARDHLNLKAPDPDSLPFSKPELPDTEDVTYSSEDFDILLRTALDIAETEGSGYPGASCDSSTALTPSQAILVAGALSICGTFGRRIDQTRKMTTAKIEKVKMLGKIRGLEFQFPRETEKGARFKDAKFTVATINEKQHPLQYRAVEILLGTRGVQTSGLLFPSVPWGKSIQDKLSRRSVTQDTLRTYLRKLERTSGVEEVEDRAFHGLKRLAATRCETEKELELLVLTSNTSIDTLKNYHKKLGTFSNEITRQAQEESLRRAIEAEAEHDE